MQTFNENQKLRLPILATENTDSQSWLATHNEAIRCARNLKKSYADLLKVLIEVERREIFYQLEKTCLYRYCVDILELPKHTAYDFIDVVRTSKTIPDLAQAVIDGKTSISKARRVCSVITDKNQKEWIGLVTECTQEVIQKCVAMANPRAAVQESMNYVSGDVLEITFAVSEEWAELLKETKDLLSTRERRSVSTEEAIFILMAENKKRLDPVQRAERARVRRAKQSVASLIAIDSSKSADANETGNVLSLSNGSPAKRGREDNSQTSLSEIARYVPMDIDHEVTLRDLNQCTFVDQDGMRCSSKRWLERHHIVEFAKGGQHSLANLETLCSAHHRMKHRSHARQ